MKSVIRALPLCLAVMAVQAHAQSVSPSWNAYRKQQAQGAAQPVPQSQPEPSAPAPQPPARAPAPISRQPSALHSAPQNDDASSFRSDDATAGSKPEGGFFIGANLGNGWVYEDLKQDAAFLSTGYRWQAGSVVKVGIEAVAGRLKETEQNDRLRPEVKFYSLGATARFNFGTRSPVYGIARLGYFNANVENDENDIYGAYASAGLGIDFGRHFSVNLLYTNYVLATDYSYYTYVDTSTSPGQSYPSYYIQEYRVENAETVTLGLEVRF